MPKPTTAQTRELRTAIYTGRPVPTNGAGPTRRLHDNLLAGGWITPDGQPTDAAYETLGVNRAPLAEQLHHLNQPMLKRLGQCAADSSSNWAGRITLYPPEARQLIDLIETARRGTA